MGGVSSLVPLECSVQLTGSAASCRSITQEYLGSSVVLNHSTQVHVFVVLAIPGPRMQASQASFEPTT